MASALLVKLLFVHFTADYLLQFDFLAEGKKKYGLRSWHVWTHVAIRSKSLTLARKQYMRLPAE